MRLPLQWKILAGCLVVAVMSLGVAAWLALGVFESRDKDHLRAGLTAQTRLVGELFTGPLDRIAPDMQQIDLLADRLGESIQARITVIAPDGKVLAIPMNPGTRFAAWKIIFRVPRCVMPFCKESASASA